MAPDISATSALNRPQLEIEHRSLNGMVCVDAYYVVIDERQSLGEVSGPEASRVRVLLATLTGDTLRMYPINVSWGSARYLQPKYENLLTISVDLSRYQSHYPSIRFLPESSDDFENILYGCVPKGFSKEFQYGLGLKWDYRFIIDAIGLIPGVSELAITAGEGAIVEGPVYRLGIDRFKQLRAAIDNLTRRYQKEAHEEKRTIAHNELLHFVAPGKFPLKAKIVRPGAIYELISPRVPRTPNLSRNDRKAAMVVVSTEVGEIARTDANDLMALHSEIERVTLGTLIEKFEKMLPAKLTEQAWQSFFKANPFILGLAFAYPVFLIQEQAYLGGSTIRGAGEKIADFLLANRYTGNLAIIEIKRPNTPILSQVKYRADLYSASAEAGGSISQVLDQKYRLQTCFAQKAYESDELKTVHPYSIHCIVIAGTSPTEKDKRKSLELFRQSTKDVTLVTFDELLEKLKELQRIFSVGSEIATIAETSVIAADVDVPF